MSPTLVITIIVASRIWHFQWNNQMRQFTKLFEMKIPGGSLALRTKGHCLVLPLLKQNNIVLRTMSVDLKIIMIRVSWFFLCRLLVMILCFYQKCWCCSPGRMRTLGGSPGKKCWTRFSSFYNTIFIFTLQISIMVKSLHCRRKSGWGSNWVQQ